MNGLILSHCAGSPLIEATEQRPLHPEEICDRLYLMLRRRPGFINHSNFSWCHSTYSSVKVEYYICRVNIRMDFFCDIFIQREPHTTVSDKQLQSLIYLLVSVTFTQNKGLFFVRSICTSINVFDCCFCHDYFHTEANIRQWKSDIIYLWSRSIFSKLSHRN